MWGNTILPRSSRDLRLGTVSLAPLSIFWTFGIGLPFVSDPVLDIAAAGSISRRALAHELSPYVRRTPPPLLPSLREFEGNESRNSARGSEIGDDNVDPCPLCTTASVSHRHLKDQNHCNNMKCDWPVGTQVIRNWEAQGGCTKLYKMWTQHEQPQSWIFKHLPLQFSMFRKEIPQRNSMKPKTIQ